jgi:RNA polymerase sigma-70 factor, ECF subfamily
VTTGDPITDAAGDDHAARFTHLRALLFTIAYEILGSATESDDVLQDSYLRWADVELATVRDTKSYLAQVVTSQALNALRARASRREDYIGPWLPEPLLLAEQDASADVVLAESVSMAMLVLLETLTPDERAVFILREVFGFHRGDVLEGVFLVEIIDDKITNLYAMRNPDKLSAFAVPRTISR